MYSLEDCIEVGPDSITNATDTVLIWSARTGYMFIKVKDIQLDQKMIAIHSPQ